MNNVKLIVTFVMASVFSYATVFSQSAPLALHQLVSIEAGGDAVIRLKSYDASGEQVIRS